MDMPKTSGQDGLPEDVRMRDEREDGARPDSAHAEETAPAAEAAASHAAHSCAAEAAAGGAAAPDVSAFEMAFETEFEAEFAFEPEPAVMPASAHGPRDAVAASASSAGAQAFASEGAPAPATTAAPEPEPAPASAGAHAPASAAVSRAAHAPLLRIDAYSGERLTALLPVPAADANKYSRGTACIVAGSVRYPGAACLAAVAAQRMGAGYTRVVTEGANVPLVQAHRASLVVRSWADLTPDDIVASTTAHPCAYAIGCGFETESETAMRLVLSFLKMAEAPIVVDGGGLGGVATVKGKRLVQHRKMRGLSTVLTPHAGEANRLALTARIPDYSQMEPPVQAHALARAYDAVVLLKGPDTYVSDGHRIVLVDCGTPALAKAGTGDVLAGMVVALLAQGLDAIDAAVLGATVHAQAGIAAAERMTEICAAPEDVLDAVPAAIRAVAAGV